MAQRQLGRTLRTASTGLSAQLASAIEITTPAALAHVWSDDFLGAVVEEPSAALPRYTVQFHVLPHGRRDVQVMYVVTYVNDPVAGTGSLYLPASGEAHYALNVRTIFRAGGRWHRAAPDWAAAVNASLRG